MDDHEVRRHVAVLEDRLDRISQDLDELIGTVDHICTLTQLICRAMREPPETGVPEVSDVTEGAMH